MSDTATQAEPAGGPSEEVNRDAFGIQGEDEGQQQEPLSPEDQLAADLTRAFEEREQRSSGGPGEAGGEAPSPPAEPPSTQEGEEGGEAQADVSVPEPAPGTEPPAGQEQQQEPVTPPVIPGAGPAPQPTDGEFEQIAAVYRQAYGRLPTVEEIQAQIAFQNDLARLAQTDPARLAQMEALLYDQSQQQVTGQQVPPPAGQAPPEGLADEPDPYLEAALSQRLGPIQQTVEGLAGYVQSQEQQRVQAQQQQIASEVTAGAEKFATDHSLTEAERDALQDAVVRSGIFPGLFSAHGNGEAAMEQAMSQMYWSTPEFRDREFERQAAEQAAQQADTSKKKAKAGAVAGTSGTVSREEPVPTTKQGRLAAMAQELRTAQEQGG